MKKFTKIAALAALLAVSAAAFVGCGEQNTQTGTPETSAVVSTAEESSAAAEDTSSTENDVKDASIVGEWKAAYIIDENDQRLTLEEYSQSQGVDTEGVDVSMIFDLKEDGTGTVSMGGIGVPFTYTFDGTAMTYTVTGEDGTEQTSSYNYDADEDVLFYTDEASGMTSVLERNA